MITQKSCFLRNVKIFGHESIFQRKVVSKMNIGVTLQLFHSPSRVMRIVYILLPLRVGYHKCSINRILPKRPRRWGNRNEIEEY